MCNSITFTGDNLDQTSITIFILSHRLWFVLHACSHERCGQAAFADFYFPLAVLIVALWHNLQPSTDLLIEITTKEAAKCI